MEIPIVIYGSPVLRKKSYDVEEKYAFRGLVENMFQTLKAKEGIGLAAPQVGLLKNLFIIDTTPLEKEETGILEKAYINPEILSRGAETNYFSEGCLSIPGIFEEVKRPDKIEVRYRDIHFRWQEQTMEGIASRIFQHEYDHLQGILFIDHLHTLRKKLLRKKLNKISKGSFKN